MHSSSSFSCAFCAFAQNNSSDQAPHLHDGGSHRDDPGRVTGTVVSTPILFPCAPFDRALVAKELKRQERSLSGDRSIASLTRLALESNMKYSGRWHETTMKVR